MAYPTPARPPRVAEQTALDTIRAQTERVAELEDRLATERARNTPESFVESSFPARASPRAFSGHDPGGADDGSPSERLQSEIASALAQFTLSEYDGEYIIMGRSTIISTMGKLNDTAPPPPTAPSHHIPQIAADLPGEPARCGSSSRTAQTNWSRTA
ncbi:hypothetical protein PLICRDRAFT_52352 [Plicaturopsis crispa FD-325 SS-3]|nr:hypothetical protein PLICRDRAFT_52352 [Plicaturopsis crispa FD-325 SS-3]